MTIEIIKPHIIFSGKILKPGTIVTVTPEYGDKLIQDGKGVALNTVPLEYFIKDLKGEMPDIPPPSKDEEE
jgi:hypothetical protein